MARVGIRTVTVQPERLERWLDTFGTRHGPPEATFTPERLTLRAPDGAVAVIAVPFPPGQITNRAGLLGHAGRERTVAALLVRRGGVAVGVFRHRELLAAKIETGYVQGRTKAGGWSQQRYARRRAGQAQQLWSKAADVAARLLLPYVGELDAVAAGGDAGAVRAVLADPRLAPLAPLLLPQIRPVPDPRLAVLQAFPDHFLGVEITLNDLA